MYSLLLYFASPPASPLQQTCRLHVTRDEIRPFEARQLVRRGVFVDRDVTGLRLSAQADVHSEFHRPRRRDAQHEEYARFQQTPASAGERTSERAMEETYAKRVLFFFSVSLCARPESFPTTRGGGGRGGHLEIPKLLVGEGTPHVLSPALGTKSSCSLYSRNGFRSGDATVCTNTVHGRLGWCSLTPGSGRNVSVPSQIRGPLFCNLSPSRPARGFSKQVHDDVRNCILRSTNYDM